MAIFGSKGGQKDKVKSPLEELKRKDQRKEIESPLESDSEKETLQQQQVRDHAIHFIPKQRLNSDIKGNNSRRWP